MSGPDLQAASLTDLERRTLDQFTGLLREGLGDRLLAVWLYGSRARGERPHAESDVDLIVVTREGEPDRRAVADALWEAAESTSANAAAFSTHVFSPDWIAERRAIRSFYLQEVDRDKIVLAGEP